MVAAPFGSPFCGQIFAKRPQGMFNAGEIGPN